MRLRSELGKRLTRERRAFVESLLRAQPGKELESGKLNKHEKLRLENLRRTSNANKRAGELTHSALRYCLSK